MTTVRVCRDDEGAPSESDVIALLEYAVYWRERHDLDLVLHLRLFGGEQVEVHPLGVFHREGPGDQRWLLLALTHVAESEDDEEIAYVQIHAIQEAQFALSASK